MTVTDIPTHPIVSAARDLRSRFDRRWRDASPTTRTRFQIALFVGVVLVAYHYSLTTLMQSLSLDTPLAYIGLVPLIALGLAAVRSRPLAAEPAIHDRQVDFIVGVPLMTAALATNVLLPRKLSAMFWVWRIDLLSLPFFVAGAVAIVFGVRALWRQRLAVSYLILIWPVPYNALLQRYLNLATSVTIKGLHTVVHVVHVAVPLPSSDGSVFTIVHAGRAFSISVVSACSGVNGMVGFLLVGSAFGAIVTGPRLRKVAWLVGGLFLLWMLNLVRLTFIFWAGRHFGEHFALKVLHPFVGLITFNLGVIAMLFLLRPMGLRIRTGKPPPDRPAPDGGSGVATGRLVLAVPVVYSAIALVTAFGLVLGATNSGLAVYDLVAQATGEPKLASYLANPAAPAGWNATFATQYDWAKPFFGESSVWYRYLYSPALNGGDLRSNLPVTADVINTSDLSSFSAYGVEACYRFHGYSLHDVVQVELGGGISGQALSYSTSGRDHQDWTIVYWIWPVRQGMSSSIRYERVILYVLNTGIGAAPGDSAGASLVGSVTAGDATARRLTATRTFLVSFAREIIQAQTRITPGSQLSTVAGGSTVISPYRRMVQERERARSAASAAASGKP